MNLFPKEILFGISFFICLYAKPETLMMGGGQRALFRKLRSERADEIVCCGTQSGESVLL